MNIKETDFKKTNYFNYILPSCGEISTYIDITTPKNILDDNNNDINYCFITLCKNGDINRIKKLIDENNKDKFNIDMGIKYACFCDKIEVVKYLYELKLPLYIYEMTLWACKTGKLELFKYLYIRCHDINIYALFNSAYEKNKTEIISYLLDVTDFDSEFIIEAYNDAVNNNNNEMVNCLFDKIWEHDNYKLFACLLPYITDINEIFIQACEEGKINTIKCILNTYPELNDTVFGSGFNKACHWDKLEVIKYLVNIRPNVNIKLGLTQTDNCNIKNFLQEIVKL